MLKWENEAEVAQDGGERGNKGRWVDLWMLENIEVFGVAELTMENEGRKLSKYRLQIIIHWFEWFSERPFECCPRPTSWCSVEVLPRSHSNRTYESASRKDWCKLRCKVPWFTVSRCSHEARKWGSKKMMAHQHSSKMKQALSCIDHQYKLGSWGWRRAKAARRPYGFGR